MDSKKIIYIGMEETGFTCLERLITMGADIARVYTIDESYKDRIIAHKPFDSLGERFGVPIKKIKKIADPAIISEIKEINPDLIYVVSWSQLIPLEIINMPPLGCVGFHGTLLPKHRGRAPVPWSIIFGLKRSGLTMFYLTENADDGDIIGQEEFSINQDDNAYSVYKKVEGCAVVLLEKYHNPLLEGAAPRIKQPTRDTDYWPKRIHTDGYLDWNKSARHIYDWVRALTYPFPGAFTYYNSRKMLVWKAGIFSEEPKFESGRIYKELSDKGLVVGTADGAICIQEAQFESGEKLIGRNLLNHIGENIYFESVVSG